MPRTRKQVSVLEAVGAVEKDAHEEYQDDDWEESQQVKRPTAKRRAAPTLQTRRRKPQIKTIAIDSSDDPKNGDDSSESEAIVARRRTPVSKSSAAARSRRSIRESSSSSSEEEPTPTGKRESPKRSSAVKAKQRLSTLEVGDSSSSASSAMEDSKPAARRQPASRKLASRRKKTTVKRSSRSSKGRDESDEEFDPDTYESEESSEEDAVEDESSSDEVQEIPDKRQKRSPQKDSPKRRRESIGVVLDGDVGIADDSSDDSMIASPPPKLHLQPSPKRRSTKSPPQRKPKTPPKASTGSSEGDSSVTSASSARRSIDVPQCHSKLDVITGEKLPKIHVCFFTPDQQSCQCFALQTLRKIALSASAPQYRKENSGREVQTFLQPPHFRTPMSDDLLDQIASRFGRDALKINGSYYRRHTAAIPEAATDWSNVNMPIFSDHDNDFQDQLQQYIRKTMGSQDVYACPLCYIVAHSRLVSDETNEPYETEFDKDPMSVLGYLDNDDFTIASAFCFRKVAKLKEHLRKDHEVTTNGIQGNSFYARYKIREQDGLLQRYLKRASGKDWAPRQGDMMRYWHFGNSYNFLLLLDHMGEAERCREVVEDQDNADEDELDEARSFLRPSEEYLQSFADDVNDVWENITSPFRTATQDELDFVANGSEEEEDEDEDGGLANHLALHAQSEIAEFQRRQSADDLLAARYEHMEQRMRNERNRDSRSDSDDDLLSIDNEERVYYREDASDDDDDSLQREVQRKRKVSPRKKPSPRKNRNRRQTQSTLEGFTISKKEEVITLDDSSSEDESTRKTGAAGQDSSDGDISPIVTSANRRKKRLVVDDDDDD